MRIHLPQKALSIEVSVLAIVVLAAVPMTPQRTTESNTSLFLPVVTYDPAGQSLSVAVADVNEDDKLDLLVANACIAVPGSDHNSDCAEGSISVLLGKGDGTFQSAVSYKSGGGIASWLAAADVNRDGKRDMLVANCGPIGINTCGLGDGDVGVLLGNGDGTFAPVVTYASGGIAAESVAVADVNGDGKPDLLVRNTCGISSTCHPGSVGVLLGNGDGTFQAAATYPSGMRQATALAVADVNGDGESDLLVGADSNGNNLGALLGNGDGTFRSVVTFNSGGNTVLSIAVADVNGDRKVDLLVGNQCDTSIDCAHGSVGVLLGNGDGTFKSAVSYNPGGTGSWAVAVADVNGDGKLDALAANFFYSTVGALLGNGDGTFQTAITYSPGGMFPRSLAVANLNGDGKPDVAVANFCGASPNCLPGKLGVLLNNAADTTPPAITLPAFPRVLWPANRQLVPVIIFGTITDVGLGVKAGSATYAVKDEYGKVQPKGHIRLDDDGKFRFNVVLLASRRSSDLNGRQYTITIRAKDYAGNAASKTGYVIVPHGMNH